MAESYALAAERKLIIALDIPDIDAAYSFAQSLELPDVTFKIGLELLFVGGADLARRLAREGYSIFIDAKLLDIGRTVERATAQIAGFGAKFLTIHAQDKVTLEAALRGAKGSDLKLLGVTVLTSTSQATLKEQGHELSTEELVLKRASFAAETGLHGIISSPLEAAILKRRFGERLAVITPGISPHSEEEVASDDQARTATPRQALIAGADSIVVGRPILKSADPKSAARAIVDEMAKTLAELDSRF